MIRSPLHPSRLPFFYGWVVLFAGTLGVLSSLPGQTIGVSAFTEPLLEALGLSRNQISVAYMLGTIASSFMLTTAGMAYDRFGARRVGAAACLLLGCVLLTLSRVDRLVEAATARFGLPADTTAFGVILLCFFLLRFSGQGVLTMVSRNMMMKWFDRHRGLVTAVSGFAIAPVFSSAPLILNRMVERHGWRDTWTTLGLVCGFGFAAVCLLLYRDNPEAFGLKPDGPLGGRFLGSRRGERPVLRDFTLPEARRSPVFWIFALGVSLFGMFVTGLSFHIASVFESAGRTAEEGFAVFLPGAVIALTLRPVVGWSADRFPVKYLLVYMMAALCLSGLGLLWLKHPAGIGVLIVGNGLAGSCFDTLMSVTWPNFFGRKHLGAISGLSMSVTVFASALGPVLFSLVFDQTGTYAAAGVMIIALAATILFLALPTRNPQLAP